MTPALIDATWQNRPRKLLVQANRNGYFYVLDRTDGRFLLGKQYAKNVTWASSVCVVPWIRKIWCSSIRMLSRPADQERLIVVSVTAVAIGALGVLGGVESPGGKVTRSETELETFPAASTAWTL